MTDAFNPPTAGMTSGWPARINETLRNLDSRIDSRDLPGERLIIYYSYPQGVNELFNVERAAQLFARWDLIVFGQPLQEPDHEAHADTVAVIERIHELNPRAKVFGYVSVRVSLADPPALDPLTDQEIRDQIDAWQEMGVDGMLLDEFGFDYNVPRTRQNMAVDHVHNAGLVCLINAWVQADAFAPDTAAALEVDPFADADYHDDYNPGGVPSRIRPGDYTLLETWVSNTAFYPGPAHVADIFNIEARARHARTYRERLGVKWLGGSVVNYGDPEITAEQQQDHFDLTQAFARLFAADGWAVDGLDYSAHEDNLAMVKPWAFDRRPQPRGIAPWIAGNFLTLDRQDLQLTLTGTSTASGSAWTFTENA